MAVAQSRPYTVKLLLENCRIDINSTDDDGQTPLHHCARTTCGWNSETETECANFECFEILLKHPRINVNVVDSKYRSAFLLLLQHNKKIVMALLIVNLKIKYLIQTI